MNNIWQRTFHFKALIAIFLGLQTLWPYSLTKPDYLDLGCSFGLVLSKTKSVTPTFFYISDISNSSKYNFDVSFTVFYGLIDAIPNVWKDKIKRQNQNGKINQNDNTTFNTNSIYSSILKSSFVPPTSQNRILHHDFTENNVHKVYQLPFTITKEVKVIMFQYKIIHNILPTQISLYRDGFSDSDVCPLCHHEQQTLSHLLITCIKTASFWQTFQVWWYGKTDENLLLNQGKILYGFFENTAHWHIELFNYTSEIPHLLY